MCNMETDSIVKLQAVCKDYLWGGTKLRDIYNKKSDSEIIAESWELSAHPDGTSMIASGNYKGMLFSEYINRIGAPALGHKYDANKDFPLLIKLIDAKQDLSVQVHPDDAYALEHENGYGKTEMWYVIDSEPGAGLYVGFDRDVSKEEVLHRISDNTIMEVLRFHPTKPGDIFFIPAGTVHAIGAGNLICEIQQNSNSTYRLYDHDRKDKFGNPRELHISKALDVLNYHEYIQAVYDDKVSCEYFDVSLIKVNGKQCFSVTEESFCALTCIKGHGELILDKRITVDQSETFFIPAADKTIEAEGDMLLIACRM